MKKLLPLIALLFSVHAFSQLSENFGAVSAAFPPTGWALADNGINPTSGVTTWTATTTPTLAYLGTGQAAFLGRMNVTDGTLAQDWLITPQVTVPANGQLRFFTRKVQAADFGGVYTIRVTSGAQTTLASYTTIQTWTESDLVTTYNVYEEKVLPLAAFAGQNVHIAFVMEQDNADRWLIDNVNVVNQCAAPTALNATNIGVNTATLGFTGPAGATQYEVEVLPQTTLNFTGVGVLGANPFNATGLLEATAYKYRVRAICSSGFPGLWSTPFDFTTARAGQTCSAPIVTTALPYTNTNNTSNFLDLYDVQLSNTCMGSGTNYFQGNDAFYTFTPTVNGNYLFTLTPTTANSSLSVYSACPTAAGATCLGGAVGANSNVRNVTLNNLVAGTTYYVLVSSSAASQTVGYTLNIQQLFCAQPAGLTTAAITSNSANLSWTNPSSATEWQLVLAPGPVALPSGAGVTVTTNTNYAATGLLPGTVYQYYVRAKCIDGNYSIWVGPSSFTTLTVATPLNYTDNFQTPSSWTLNNGTLNQANKWTIGNPQNSGTERALYITGNNGATWSYNGSTSISHAYKDFTVPAGTAQLDLTFDFFNFGDNTNDLVKVWTVPSTTVINSGTAITPLANSRIQIGANLLTSPQSTLNYTLDAVPYAGNNVRVVFEWRNDDVTTVPPPAAIDNFVLKVITCAKPTALTFSSITYNAAQLAWTNGNAETQWEVIVLPAGSPAPTATSTGTIVNTNPFNLTNLTSITTYNVYVRARCSSTDFSFWSPVGVFTTTPNYCAGDLFTDSGNLTANYSNNETRTSTICPTNAGDVVTYVFNNFDVDSSDNLKIYHGSVLTAANLIGTYTGNTLPPSFTSTAANGCITFVFTSNASFTAPGWSANIYCTAPITCLKPLTPSVTSITPTSASLNWVANGVATQYQVLVLPFGSTAPSPTANGITTTNPYLASGLNPGTTYTFYVRGVCSANDRSFWTDGVTFTTPPLNDECSTAITVLVNDDLNCQQTTNGSLGGATASAQTAPICNNTDADDDVWFKFTAVKTSHTISLSNFLPANANLDYAVYSGANCNALTEVICNAADNDDFYNAFVVGQTYYVRVFSTGTTKVNSTFKLCIGSIPCPESISLCTTSITYPNTTGVVNLGGIGCLFSSPNASFFFLEASQNGNLGYNISQITTAGNPIDVDYALWGPFVSRNAACGVIPSNQAPLTGLTTGCSYSASATEFFNIPVLQGQVYILMVTNFANQAGSVTLSPQPTNTAQAICYPYNTFNYSALAFCNNSPNATPVLLAGAVAGTYTASPAGLVIDSVTGTINFGASLPGEYVVTNTIIPNLNAPASNSPIIATKTVIVTPIPNATLTYSSNRYCASNNNFQQVTIAGTQGGFFSAVPGGLNIDTVSGNIIPSLSLPGIYTITYNVAPQGGCAAYTTTKAIEIVAAPSIPAQVDVNSCNNYTLPPLTVGNYFTQSGGLGTALTAGTVLTTNQTIYVYATNGLCNAEDPFNVNIISTPVPTFTFVQQPTCDTQTGSINVTSPLLATGSIPGNLFISEITDADSGSLTYVELYNATGAAVNLSTYKLRVFNNGGAVANCDLPLSGTIANNSTFVIKLSSDANITGVTPNLSLITCSGVNTDDNIQLTTTANAIVDNWGINGTVFTPANQPGYTYRRKPTATIPSNTFIATDWTTVDPENYSNLGSYTLNIQAYQYSVDTGTFQTSTLFSGIAPGTHTLTVRDLLNNCTSLPVSFTITPVPVINTAFSFDTNVCVASSTNPSPILSTGFTPGGTFTSTAGITINTTTGVVNLLTSTPGTYTVTYNVPTNLVNCTNSTPKTATITIKPQIMPAFNAIAAICQGTTAPTLPITSTNGVTGTWSPSSISTTNAGSFNYTFTPTAGICAATKQITVVINQLITPTFTNIPNLCLGDPKIVLPTTSINGITGVWSSPEVLTNNSGVTNYTFTPNVVFCASPVTLSANVELCEIQKGISPNNDGKNDFLKLVAKKVEIFNRYGRIIYTKEDYNNEWYGQLGGGGETPDGTYFYVIKLINGEQKTGWIYVNRER